jgi:hypothetical protein
MRLHQVKVHSTLNVSYSAQQLTHNGARIDIADAEAPLSSLSILAGDTIYVGEDLTADTTNDESLFDSAFATIVDIPDSSSGGSSKPLALERGFRGSALMEFQPHTGSSSGSGGSSSGAIAAPAGVKRGLSADDAMCCDDSTDSANVAEYLAAAAAAAADDDDEQPDAKKQCLDATQSDDSDEVVSLMCDKCGMLNAMRAEGQLCIDCGKPLLE